MDPLGNNKIFAAILGSALVYMGLKTMPHALMDHEYPKKPVYWVGEKDTDPGGPPVELPFPQAEWVAAMDETAGARVFKKCVSCHNVDVDGANSTGPALYGIVGQTKGQVPGFAYSAVMGDGAYAWGWEELDGFLEKPSAYMKGTKMNFIGLKKAEDRAAVIEYLRVNADSPLPRPEPAPIPAEVQALLDGTAEGADVTVPAEEQQEVMTPEQIREVE
jgi:cytochrome c